MSEEQKSRAGRPAVGPQITIRIAEQMLVEIDGALAPDERRADFIRGAIAKEIERRST